MTPDQWELGTKEVKLSPVARKVVHRLAKWCTENDTHYVTLALFRYVDDTATNLTRGGGPYRLLVEKHKLLRRVQPGIYELALPWHLAPTRQWTPALIERFK